MAENPYPIPQQLRESEILFGDGGDTYGPFDFEIFDTSDVVVLARAGGAPRFTEVDGVVVEKVNGNNVLNPLDFFTVQFPTAVPATTRYIVISKRLASRDAGVIQGTRINPDALEKEFSKLATQQQELRRDINRAWQSDPGQPGLTLDSNVEDGDVLMRQGDRLVAGPTASEIGSAQEYAEQALASQLLSREWAEGTEPGGPDTKSAREWAQSIPDFGAFGALFVSSRASAISTYHPAAAPDFIRTAGYLIPDDGGGALYKKVASAPAHEGKMPVTLVDGATVIWYELSIKQEIYAEMFGAQPNVSASQNVAIANAIAFVKAKGGATLNFGRGYFTIDQTVNVQSSNIKLKGRGAGDFHYLAPWIDYETAFSWSGAANGTMVNFNPTDNGGMWLSGAGFEGIFLKANGIAGTSLSVNSSFGGKFEVVSADYKTRAMVLGVNTANVTETKDSMHNEIWVRGNSLDGSLLVLAGSPDANSCFNRISVDGNYKTNHGIQIYNADNNIFTHVRMYRETGGAGAGVVLNGGAANEEARGNIFIDLSPGAGGVVALGTESGVASASKENYCLFYDIHNFAPVPIIGTGATFWYATLDNKFPYSKVRIGNVTVNSAVDTTIPISSVDADLTGMRSGNTFVAPKPGVYRVEYTIHHGSGIAAGDKYILKVNGGKNGVYNTVFGMGAAYESSITGSVSIECDKGSVISLTLQRASGSGSFVTGADTSLSSVTVSYVSRGF